MSQVGDRDGPDDEANTHKQVLTAKIIAALQMSVAPNQQQSRSEGRWGKNHESTLELL